MPAEHGHFLTNNGYFHFRLCSLSLKGVEGDGTETQYTYYPATIADATSGTMVTTVQASDTLLGQTTPAGE